MIVLVLVVGAFFLFGLAACAILALNFAELLSVIFESPFEELSEPHADDND